MPTATLELTPPRSMNRASGEHYAARHRRKRAAQGDLAMLLLAADVPRPIPGARVHASAELRFPQRRRRDEGNYRTALEKALGDALAPHDPDSLFRWLPDDTPDHFTFGAVTFAHVPGRPALAVVTLAWGEDLARLLEEQLRRLRETA